MDNRREHVSILTFSTLYPSEGRPRHGIFVEERLRQLIRAQPVAATVVAPTPDYPLWRPRTLARLSSDPKLTEPAVRHGLKVIRPAFPVVPGLTNWINPFLLASSTREPIARLRRMEDFDLIDAHYFYPDGVAAVMVGRSLRRPVVITARGSDINVHARSPVEGRMIRWAMRGCAAVVTVSQALRDRLIHLGGAPERIHVLRNGVDLETFRPLPRDSAVSPQRRLLCVGNLVREKGFELAIRLLAELPDCTLHIAGDGPMRSALKELAERLAVDARLRLLGEVSRTELTRIYNDAELLLLPSFTEGMPNVVLEALACGTPVVACDVGGVGELLTAPEAGRLVRTRSVQEFARAVREMLESPPDGAQTRRHAELFGWESTCRGLYELFRQVAAGATASMPAAARAV